MEEHKFVCDSCKFKCNSVSHWNIHIETELHKTGKRKKRCDYKEPFKCNECDYITKNNTTLKKHILNEHADKEKRKSDFRFYCKYCDFGTFSQDTMNIHNETKKHKTLLEFVK